MPRGRHDNVRASHKEAWGLAQSGFDLTLLCKEAPVDEYLGMRVLAADAHFEGLLRPLLNLPGLVRQARRLDADLYVLKNPDTVLVGLLLACTGRRVIYTCNEDYFDKVDIHPVIPRPLSKLFGAAIVACEFVLTRFASLTVVTQPNVQQRYRPRSLLVENAPLTEGPVVREAERVFSSLAPCDTPTLVYSGEITRNRGLFRMLDLLARLNEASTWRLKLAGPFMHAGDLDAAMDHPAWQYVDYVGHVSHAESLAHIRQADIGLGLLSHIAGYPNTSITKLYEYMYLQTPFVVSDFARWRDSIDGAEAGLFVDPDDVDAIARQVDELYADATRLQKMRAEGRQFILDRFNWRQAYLPVQQAVFDMLGAVTISAT